MRVTAKINLMNLQAAIRLMKGKDGGMIECIVLPIEGNRLFKGDKGVYLDLVGFEITKPHADSKDTHLIKQSFNKEDREKIGEEKLKSFPILGNLRIWEGGGEGEPASSMEMGFEDDGLPF